jgi:hypothetical protein
LYIVYRFKSLKGFEGNTVVLVDGAFDITQPNHDWYLRHCRLLGAKLFLENHGHPVDKRSLGKVAASKAVALAVTVDADHKVSAKKGGVAEKGGVRRPVYPWQLRAERITGLSFSLNGVLSPVVDLATVEGDPRHAIRDNPKSSFILNRP